MERHRQWLEFSTDERGTSCSRVWPIVYIDCGLQSAVGVASEHMVRLCHSHIMVCAVRSSSTLCWLLSGWTTRRQYTRCGRCRP